MFACQVVYLAFIGFVSHSKLDKWTGLTDYLLTRLKKIINIKQLLTSLSHSKTFETKVNRNHIIHETSNNGIKHTIKENHLKVANISIFTT